MIKTTATNASLMINHLEEFYSQYFFLINQSLFENIPKMIKDSENCASPWLIANHKGWTSELY